jgi:signal transduction histidine kinase
VANSGTEPTPDQPSENRSPVSDDPRFLPARFEITAVATRTDDPGAALEAMLGLFVRTFQADAGAIALVSPDTGSLVTEVQVGAGVHARRGELKTGHGITEWCALNRRPILVPELAAEPRYIANRAAARCEMAAPMIDHDQIIGVVDLEVDRVGEFSPADLALLDLLASEAAQVMRRLWQLGHLKNKSRQLESLITAGQFLVTKLDQQALFDTLAREARRMLQARACALYLHDPGTATVHAASLAGAESTPLPTGPLPIDSCLVGAPINTRRQAWFADVQSPEFRELADLPADATLRSVLATPMLFEGEVLGVVAIFTGQVHRFDNDEKRLCAALASLGSVALQNARLYARVFESEDVLRKNERLTTLGLLAAEIAHEIRNPLTVLKLLQGGLGTFPEGDPRRTDMRVIGEKLDQLEAIVGRVLSFAQAPSSLHSRCSLSDIITDTLVLVRLKFTQGKVGTRFEPSAQPLFVSVHKGQIQQVLLNVLLNAAQAMTDGGSITLSATVDDRASGSFASLDITDTGPGVPDAIRARIFDSFLSGRTDGTGLGLAIAKRILMSHHGDIALLNSGPSGTTMRITLPLA